MAAAIQSVVYGAAVPAGSAFAILQSIGATGTLVPAVVAAVGAAGAAGAAEGGGGGEGAGGENGNVNEDGENGDGAPGPDPGPGGAGGESETKEAEAQLQVEPKGNNIAESLPSYKELPLHISSPDDPEAPMEIGDNGTLNAGRGGDLVRLRPGNNNDR